jgi:hypothetical protein
MDGNVTPSPTPMPIRAANNAAKPAAAANGVISVKNDHDNTPMPSTILPPKRSARRPPSTCVRR